ncbi:MAG TPA: sodium:solute symporter [Bacteroidetes bacterium]|nr:sodium:solute symporter [Bacteroidota bacterium]HRK05899.1 sodium:solute symporter [Chlorobiota bacterium]
MTAVDWIVFFTTLVGIVLYGIWRGRGKQNADAYLRADRQLPWYVVLLGVMATQASAITFLSAPGQAFTDGMRFVQYYFGLPLAMIVICATFIPIFRRQNVFTAYEYLEHRFDKKTRLLTSILFLISRALSTGISIYAPSIIVASLLEWNIYLTNILVGGLLLLYTMRGGARAVAHTQTLMFGIILTSMAAAAFVLVKGLPGGMGLDGALTLAGASGKLNVITTDIDLNDRYNLLSGIIGGFFLALSYFGTDQSQVGRFITGKDEQQSKIGLLLNGVVKIPMQFGILLIGALLVGLYAVLPSPIFFNPTVVERVRTISADSSARYEAQWDSVQQQLSLSAAFLAERPDDSIARAAYVTSYNESTQLRSNYRRFVRSTGIAEANDTNYIFLHFVRTSLPVGLVGLIFAVVILASWGSISAAFHSLATASFVDIDMLLRRKDVQHSDVGRAQIHTLVWGIFCIGVSMLAVRMGSLIEAVNILGSLFYGPILGIFLTAFWIRRAGGTAVFYGALAAEVVVGFVWWTDVISFLWLNVIGCVVVMLVAYGSTAARTTSATH